MRHILPGGGRADPQERTKEVFSEYGGFSASGPSLRDWFGGFLGGSVGPTEYMYSNSPLPSVSPLRGDHIGG